MFRKGKKRHSSSSSQSSEISTKSKSVDSSLGGLSRSSTVASLDTDSTKSSGQSNSNSDTCAEFRVKYVGAIEKLKYNESKSLEGPLDLINYIDVAQQDGKLPFVPGEEEFIMGVSKYGIKVSTCDQYTPFRYWKVPQGLPQELSLLLAEQLSHLQSSQSTQKCTSKVEAKLKLNLCLTTTF
ncbi:integrin beta-1-binding protein 1 isoform X2 [Passer montanus]|uniref:integrin beta-1-binding protein 1 isoform X2 n=1 Tax=Passer montanus TaxID=9160 RepID=UPI001960BC01|nr:integrin beta-1-binding protein 1 isoform X2 [Passer montanus]